MLKPNEKYCVNGSYSVDDEDSNKISVSSGDVVKVLSSEGDWTEVVNVKTKVKGRIPTDNVGGSLLITGGSSISWFGWNVDAVLINTFIFIALAVLTYQKYIDPIDDNL